jgi:hypothetical protein
VSRELDDQLVIALLVLAVAIALLGMSQPAVLVVGVALGGGGVALGMRGKRELPTTTRRWLFWLLAVAMVGVLGSAAVSFYESWETGQLLAFEASVPMIEAQIEQLSRLRMALQLVGVIGALALLGLAVVAYVRREPAGEP